MEITPDTKIVGCCSFAKKLYSNDEIIFVTNDIACKMIASKIFNLSVESVCENNRDIYKGYREVNKLDKPIDFGEDNMSKMEEHYHLDREKLRLLGIIRN